MVSQVQAEDGASHKRQARDETAASETISKVPDKLKQARTFVKRDLVRKFADKQYLIINLLEPPLLAFILGYFSKYVTDGVYLFSENKNYPVFLFMSVVVALFLGLTVSAEEIFKDRKILEREKYLNISRWSYLQSKITLLFGLSAVQTLMYVVVAQYILHVEGMMWRHWLILFYHLMLRKYDRSEYFSRDEISD
ncbi:MAG: ABC transporter permease [Marinilabiliales bacterium]|nr:ABC transporter permease [Marinilabiliales bacterium]